MRLENDVDFFEILSLKISQKDIYGTFNANYGVVVGRVIANGGIGIPNAKISVFIPVSDEDKANGEIYAVYPYSSPRDKDLDGVKYNLLPRVAVNNPFLVAGQYAPTVPVGTFPTKEEITTNPTFLEVYKKYYKYTTVTNQSGDYMIFGVPIGVQTMTMSVDITDIGKYSMTPGTMINNLGYSPVLFTDNGTKVKFSTDLETLPNVETQEVAVDVKPFWGDEENFEIGITRQDFKIRALLIASFTIFGAAFTDGQSAHWGRGGNTIKQLYAMEDKGPGEVLNASIATKRNGLINETLLYLPNTITDAQITGNSFDPTAYKLLTQDQYTRYVENGQFVYIVPCNRKKIITDELGQEVVVPDDDPRGVFIEFNGFMVLDYSDDTALPMDRADDYRSRVNNTRRMRLKIPQYANVADQNNNSPVYHTDDTTHLTQNNNWRRQNKKFLAGEFYSVAKFYGIANSDGNDNEGNTLPNFLNKRTIVYSSGAVVTNAETGTTVNEFPSNGTDVNNGSIRLFASEHMNFCLYFPQYVYNSRLDDNEAGRTKLLNANNRVKAGSEDNSQLIGGPIKNTIHMARADLHETNFINVPKSDLVILRDATLNDTSPKGFRNGIDPPYDVTPLTGTDYKHMTIPYSNGQAGTYFFKGFGSADCIAFLNRIGLI